MRNTPILIIASILFIATSCDKTLQVDPISFDVTTASTTFKAGDTVHFMFKGQPDMITFYSGESGHNYEYRDRTVAQGKAQMQFTSFAQYGKQDNTLHLLISKDFDGNYDAEDINKATWTDITNMAKLSQGSNNTPSGEIDLSAFTKDDKPLYFAFKYEAVTGSTQKKWTIKDFEVNLLLADGSTSSIANMVSAGWNAISIKNDSKAWKISSSELIMAGGNSSSADNEDWLITSPLNPTKVAPDRGIAIKEITKELSEFSHIYTQSGSYKAVFIGTNATADKESSVVKTMDLNIK